MSPILLLLIHIILCLNRNVLSGMVINMWIYFHTSQICGDLCGILGFKWVLGVSGDFGGFLVMVAYCSLRLGKLQFMSVHEINCCRICKVMSCQNVGNLYHPMSERIGLK